MIGSRRLNMVELGSIASYERLMRARVRRLRLQNTSSGAKNERLARATFGASVRRHETAIAVNDESLPTQQRRWIGPSKEEAETEDKQLGPRHEKENWP